MIPAALLQLVQGSRGFRGSVRGPAPDNPAITVMWVVQGATPENATTTDGEGRPVLIYVYRKPANGPTASQAAQRRRMRAAQAVWRTMPAEERRRWDSAAKKHRITRQNAAVRGWARALAQGPNGPAEWDSGAAVWDSGAARWDIETTWDSQPGIWDAGAAVWDGYNATEVVKWQSI
jgi:hypothetical protein